MEPASAPLEKTDCGGTCVDLQSDSENCSSCTARVTRRSQNARAANVYAIQLRGWKSCPGTEEGCFPSAASCCGNGACDAGTLMLQRRWLKPPQGTTSLWQYVFL